LIYLGRWGDRSGSYSSETHKHVKPLTEHSLGSRAPLKVSGSDLGVRTAQKAVKLRTFYMRRVS